MANRTFYPSQSYGSGRVYLEVTFQTNNTSSPLASTIDGSDSLASLTRTGVGVIVAVLKDTFPTCVGASVELDDTADDGAYATSAVSVSAAGVVTITIRTRAGATTTKTDYTARKVTLVAYLKNTTGWGSK